MATTEKGRKYEQGVTQREIFRFIIRGGGSAKEPEIREFLRKRLDIKSERGVKTHLQNMESGKLIQKYRNPEHSNTWVIAYEETECYKYLCDLISLSHSDHMIAFDIDLFFSHSRRHKPPLTYVIITNQKYYLNRYITQTLNTKYIEKITEEDGGFTRKFAGWEPDNELVEIVYSIAWQSPTLFSLGATETNMLFLTLLWVLMENEMEEHDNGTQFFRWTVSNLIIASLITDFRVYRRSSVALSDEKYTALSNIFTKCGVGDVLERHIPPNIYNYDHRILGNTS